MILFRPFFFSFYPVGESRWLAEDEAEGSIHVFLVASDRTTATRGRVDLPSGPASAWALNPVVT